jgi:hypothetical protein
MKVRITHLKAPWPQGARPGDVVELASKTLPGWAIGKCEKVGDEVAATVEFAERPSTPEDAEISRIREQARQQLDEAAQAFDKLRAEHADQLRSMQSEHAAKLAEAQAALEAAVAGDAAKHQALLDKNADLTKQLAEAQAALASHAAKGNGKR